MVRVFFGLQQPQQQLIKSINIHAPAGADLAGAKLRKRNSAMTPRIPKSDAELYPFDVQEMIDRFAWAKWITGLNIDHPDYFQLQFTELGRSRMRPLVDALRPFGDCILPGARRPGIMSYFRYFFCLYRVAIYLKLHRLSDREINTLVGIALAVGRKDCTPPLNHRLK